MIKKCALSLFSHPLSAIIISLPLISFKSIFLECKSIAINQFQLKIAETEAWQNQSIDKMFQRLDVFINRCRDYWVLQDV